MRRKIRVNAEWPGGSEEAISDLPDGWDSWTAQERDEFLVSNAVDFLYTNGCGSGASVIEVDEDGKEIRVLDEDQP